MAKKLRRIALATVTCAILLAPAAASASGPWDNLLAPESACPGQTDRSLPAGAQERTMVCMHNWVRTEKGLKPLHSAKRLRSSSNKKARDIRHCRQFSHEACGRDAFYWFRRVGFMRGTWGAGENLAYGQGNLGTVRDMMSAWLNSDVHRSVLLTPNFDDVGISVLDGRFHGHRGVAIWVAHFGYHH